MGNSKHECSICGKIYSSKNHMRRHEATHSRNTCIICKFCSREFRRKDVLQRHYKNCSQRGAQLIPRSTGPGRQRKACDRCARARITCSGETPCNTCKIRELSCTYQRLRNSARVSDSPLGGTRRSDEQHIPAGVREETGRADNKTPVPFLLNYTHPSNQTPGSSNRVLTQFGPEDASHRFPETSIPSTCVEANQSDLFFKDVWETMFGPLAMFEPDNIPPSLGLDSPHQCQLAADRIISKLKETALAYPRLFEPFNVDEARSFFCSENVADFIGAYFQRGHIPIRIVHRTCFNLETVSTPLLVSVFLIGIICQLSETTSQLAGQYADIIEWSIFEDPRFLRLMYMKQEGNTKAITRDEREIIQAALLVTVVQSANPSTEVRRRIRIQRLPASLAVARALSMTKTRIRWYDASDQLDYHIFIEDEMYIRTMSLVFIMDCRFVIFYNNPPYLNPLELHFDLPADDEGIDIVENEAWELWALNRRAHGRPPPLDELIQALLRDKWDSSHDLHFDNLSIFNMLLLILAFHPTILELRTSFCDMSSAQTQLDRALARWKDLWDRKQEISNDDQIRRAGFMIQAAQDLWHYSRLLLRTPASKTGDIAHDTISNVYRVLRGP